VRKCGELPRARVQLCAGVTKAPTGWAGAFACIGGLVLGSRQRPHLFGAGDQRGRKVTDQPMATPHWQHWSSGPVRLRVCVRG
jgi:hypothetical protein